MEQQRSNSSSPPGQEQPKSNRWSKIASLVFATVCASAGAVFGGFVVHRSHVISTFETSLEEVISDQTEWLNDAAAIISAAGSGSPKYPEMEEVAALRTHVMNTVVELGSFRAPDQSLAKAADEYKKALEQLAGALNQYDGSHRSFTSAASAAQKASNVGIVFHDEVNSYSADFIRKSIRSVFWG